MELRHIRYFLAVAEEGNFTRAAEKVGIAQPPLSQQIRDLETEIGVQLFHRVPHGAELTTAGQAFLERVIALPNIAKEASEAARRAARGETGTLNLGFTGASLLNPTVSRLIRTFRRDHPDVSFKLEEGNSVELRDDLLNGTLDIAILRPNHDDPKNILTHPLSSERLIAAIPTSRDPEPDSDEIDLFLLRDEPLVLTPRHIGLSLHDSAISACRRAGFEPRLGQPAPQITSIMSMVSAEQGISLVPECMRQLALENVSYKHLKDLPMKATIATAILRGTPSPTASAFIALARTIHNQDQAPL
ncbi:DNA-binding transcriptional regulator, LysR family [Cohaesibacter marisflavi]|uniref:DNA-binding transcriptional regulator, LysR family n=1 Tax=Cohaesibacter marisflavi TaxID=655353 RepID=A0A1I5JG64_9HYPH|nr:LysR family transcriptional regulator [Cohaesibacter marisflavi]SFO71351.1 DNA-binding transcriptional regulator, LysR family [Cohaesibacter marisflavi]